MVGGGIHPHGLLKIKFLPLNLNKFIESKCYFLVDLILVVKLSLTTSAKVSSSTPGHG